MTLCTKVLAQAATAIFCQFLLLCTVSSYSTAAEQQQQQQRSLAQSVVEKFIDADQVHLGTVTRLLILKAIEFNRFILHYRLESDKQPKFRLWRYFLAEEALAGCNVGYDTILVGQLGTHLSTPQAVSRSALRSAMTTSLIGTTIGASGSVIELSSNVIRGFKNRSRGFDVPTATRYFVRILREFDDLMAERDYIVQLHRSDNSYNTFVLESKVYRQLRNFYLHEFLQFHEDTAAYRNYETAFYALNAIGDSSAASAALVGLGGLRQSGPNLASNIMYTTSGAFVTIAPLLSSAVGSLVKKHTHRLLLRQLGPLPEVDIKELQDDVQKLEALNAATMHDDNSLSTVQIALELARFTQTGQHFQSLLEEETAHLKTLSKVAVQTNTLGPAIGATALTEGFLGTIGSSGASKSPNYGQFSSSTGFSKSAVALNFAGAITGLAGSATSATANIGILRAHARYTRRLAREHRAPEQLALRRLEILDNLEDATEAMR